MASSPGRAVLADLDMNIPAQIAGQADIVHAITAKHDLRGSALKAQFKEQLRDILEDVAEEQEAYQHLKDQYQALCNKHEQLSQHATNLATENRSLITQLEHARAQNAALSTSLDAAHSEIRDKANQASAVEMMLQDERRRRQEDAAQAELQANTFNASHKQAVQDAQRLRQQLSAQDQKVIDLSQQLSIAQSAAKSAQSEITCLEVQVTSLAERVAAAEGGVAARSDAAVLLHKELCTLRDKYLGELSELKAAKQAAQETTQLKQQLAASQEVTNALVEAREELRAVVTTLTAQLAAAQEKARRLEGTARLRERIMEVLQGAALQDMMDNSDDGDDDGDSEQHHDAVVDALAVELEVSQGELRETAGRAAALEAACAKQEEHIRRLATELQAGTRKRTETDEHNRVLQRLVAEMEAELQRLASQTAVGLPIVLDMGKGVFIYPPGMDPDNKSSQKQTETVAPPCAPNGHEIASVVETACTAAHVMVVDKGYAVKSLAARLVTAAALPLDALTTQQRLIQAAANEAVTCLDTLAVHVSTRPVDLNACCDAVCQTCAKLTAVTHELTDARHHLVTSQTEVVAVEVTLSEVRAGLQGACDLLAGWSHLIARKMSEGEIVDDAMRQQLRTELQAADQALHRCAAQLSTSTMAGTVGAGEVALAGIESGVRAAQSALLDLAARLPERELLSDAKLKAAVISTELAVKDRERAVARVHTALTSAPAGCAALAAEITCVVNALNILVGNLQQLGELLERQRAAGRDIPLDPVALQGEVIALRAQLSEANQIIAGMESQGKALRPAHEGGLAVALVPLDALHASERGREAANEQASDYHSSLVQQRLRHAAARMHFVGFYDRLRATATMRCVFAAWKMQLLESKMTAAEEIITQLDVDKVHLQEHAVQRRALVTNVLSRMLVDNDVLQAKSMLLAWRVVSMKQVAVKKRWEMLVDGAMKAMSRALGAYPMFTVAQRLAAFKAACMDPWSPPLAPRSDDHLLLLMLRAWRSWATIRMRNRRAVVLSAGMPAMVAALGARRRLERAWLGWRLEVVSGLVAKANDQLHRHGQLGVGRKARNTEDSIENWRMGLDAASDRATADGTVGQASLAEPSFAQDIQQQDYRVLRTAYQGQTIEQPQPARIQMPTARGATVLQQEPRSALYQQTYPPPAMQFDIQVPVTAQAAYTIGQTGSNGSIRQFGVGALEPDRVTDTQQAQHTLQRTSPRQLISQETRPATQPMHLYVPSMRPGIPSRGEATRMSSPTQQRAAVPVLGSINTGQVSYLPNVQTVLGSYPHGDMPASAAAHALIQSMRQSDATTVSPMKGNAPPYSTTTAMPMPHFQSTNAILTTSLTKQEGSQPTTAKRDEAIHIPHDTQQQQGLRQPQYHVPVGFLPDTLVPVAAFQSQIGPVTHSPQRSKPQEQPSSPVRQIAVTNRQSKAAAQPQKKLQARSTRPGSFLGTRDHVSLRTNKRHKEAAGVGGANVLKHDRDAQMIDKEQHLSGPELIARAHALTQAMGSLVHGLQDAAEELSPRSLEKRLGHRMLANSHSTVALPPQQPGDGENPFTHVSDGQHAPTAQTVGRPSSPQRQIQAGVSMLKFDPALAALPTAQVAANDTQLGSHEIIKTSGGMSQQRLPASLPTAAQDVEGSAAAGVTSYSTQPAASSYGVVHSRSEQPYDAATADVAVQQSTSVPMPMQGKISADANNHQQPAPGPTDVNVSRCIVEHASNITQQQQQTTITAPSQTTAATDNGVVHKPKQQSTRKPTWNSGAAKGKASHVHTAPVVPSPVYGHVSSRLNQPTISSHVKKVGPGLPGGVKNLTAWGPAPPILPISAPLNTYVQGSNSTPGPATGCKATQGELLGKKAKVTGSKRSVDGAPSHGSGNDLLGFSIVYGNEQGPEPRMGLLSGPQSSHTTETVVPSTGNQYPTRTSAVLLQRPGTADQSATQKSFAKQREMEGSTSTVTAAQAVQAIVDNVKGSGTLRGRLSVSPRSTVNTTAKQVSDSAGSGSPVKTAERVICFERPQAVSGPNDMLLASKPFVNHESVADVKQTAATMPLTVTMKLPEPIRFSLTAPR